MMAIILANLVRRSCRKNGECGSLYKVDKDVLMSRNSVGSSNTASLFLI